MLSISAMSVCFKPFSTRVARIRWMMSNCVILYILTLIRSALFTPPHIVNIVCLPN
jgi:hypothetical protein